MKDNVLKIENNILNSIKGSFSPEQFGVFINVNSESIEDNYLVYFHECFHYWQSIFTPYGHLKWGCYRTVSSEVIKLWLDLTKNTPTERILPAGSMLPCKSIQQLSGVAKIFLQDYASKIVSLEERINYDETIKAVLPISLDDICPIININGRNIKLNGIDIIESFAKFQEAVLGYLLEGKSISSTIDIERLSSEYYTALYYFIMLVGYDRIYEFPIICELALTTDELCIFDNSHNWKNNHPAWRFVKMVELLSTDKSICPLKLNSIKRDFISYSNHILRSCGFKDYKECWRSSIEYASQNELNLAKEMLKAIDFKDKYPWVLSHPFIDKDLYLKIKQFQPYFCISSDSIIYSVSSNSLGNEIIFENQYQAFAHQIRGNMSQRCLDRGKIQCGFSYYGLKDCKYLKSGECDGHIDRYYQLPEVKIDNDGSIIEGCIFDIFLSIMNISVKDMVIHDINKKIDIGLLKENAKLLTQS